MVTNEAIVGLRVSLPPSENAMKDAAQGLVNGLIAAGIPVPKGVERVGPEDPDPDAQHAIEVIVGSRP